MNPNSALALFAAVILFGWTSLAAGVIASLAGQKDFSNHAHRHQQVAPAQVDEPALVARAAR